MSGYHTSDQEQIQMIKDWWKKYGTTILMAIMVFFIVNFSWQFWQNYHRKYVDGASLMYTQMLSMLQMKKIDEAQLLGNSLQKDYRRTPYASLAGLTLAKMAVEQQKSAEALTELQWVVKYAANDNLKQIAKIRAARILFADNKNQEALDLLRKVDDAGYSPAVFELKGDILLALGQKDQAISAYQEALRVSGKTQSPLLKMKLER